MGPLFWASCAWENVGMEGDAVEDGEKVGFGWTTPIWPRRRANSGRIMSLAKGMSGSSPSFRVATLHHMLISHCRFVLVLRQPLKTSYLRLLHMIHAQSWAELKGAAWTPPQQRDCLTAAASMEWSNQAGGWETCGGCFVAPVWTLRIPFSCNAGLRPLESYRQTRE